MELCQLQIMMVLLTESTETPVQRLMTIFLHCCMV